MTKFHPYVHVERLGTEDTEGILYGDVYISPKIDGTNSSVWYNPTDHKIECGSRKRIITPSDDNAAFARWVYTGSGGDAVQQNRLVTMLLNHPELQVFGEWLGTTKFIGHIKTYSPLALGKLWIFDIYNLYADHYLTPQQIYDVCAEYNLIKWLIPQTHLQNPTLDDIINAAENNNFLMNSSETIGEGIVIHNPSFKNKFGRFTIGKFVREEYKQKKSKPKPKINPADLIGSIIITYVTEAELSKAQAKTCLFFKTDVFDRKQGKMVGYFLNEVINSCIYDEIAHIVRKFKNPTIDFAELLSAVRQVAREYIGVV